MTDEAIELFPYLKIEVASLQIPATADNSILRIPLKIERQPLTFKAASDHLALFLEHGMQTAWHRFADDQREQISEFLRLLVEKRVRLSEFRYRFWFHSRTELVLEVRQGDWVHFDSVFSSRETEEFPGLFKRVVNFLDFMLRPRSIELKRVINDLEIDA